MTLAAKPLKDSLIMVSIYVFTLLFTVLLGYWLRAQPLPVVTLLGSVLGAVVLFGFGTLLKNASTFDWYWSVAPPVMALYYIFAGSSVAAPRQWLVFILVLIWSLRLSFNWYRQWGGLVHEDWRYRDISASSGRLYPLVSLGGIHVLPALLVWLGCLPLYAVSAQVQRGLGLFDLLAVGVTLLGIGVEAVADEQLWRYRQGGTDNARFVSTGLWAKTRHPNYLGELTFWWGLCLFGLAAHPTGWVFVGAVAITGLFVYSSVPMIDQRMLKRKPGYADYMKKVPGLFPWSRAKLESNSSPKQ